VDESLLTARQVADRLGVSAETVRRYTRTGKLRGIRLPGTKRGRLRYRSEEIEALLEAGETGAADRGVDSYPSEPRPSRSLRPAILSGDSYPVGDADATTEEEP
jgi:excisionase family DNA binding protein